MCVCVYDLFDCDFNLVTWQVCDSPPNLNNAIPCSIAFMFTISCNKKSRQQ